MVAAPSSVERIPAKKISAFQRDVAGEPAELFLILPPNFDQALARGKVMLVLEAKWGRRSMSVERPTQGRSYAFSAQDNAIIEQLESLTNGETPAILQMDAKDFTALLPVLRSMKTSRLENPVKSPSLKRRSNCRCAPRWKRMGKSF